jgi:hypothetical protein
MKRQRKSIFLFRRPFFSLEIAVKQTHIKKKKKKKHRQTNNNNKDEGEKENELLYFACFLCH